MSSKNTVAQTQSYEPQRRLSPWRVMLAVFILAGVLAGAYLGVQRWQDTVVASSDKPWFAPYVDVTSTPLYPFEQLGSTSQRDAVLSFIVSQPSQGCTPSWGGAYTMDQANVSLDLERRIARLQQQGGNVAVSFGGLKNQELAVTCKDESKLKVAYQSVIERYKVDTIDLDLEMVGLTDAEAGNRRAAAIAKLQSERRAQGKKLAVWVTLPATPAGLSKDGTDAVARLLAHKIDIAGVNVMTMNYGPSRTDDKSMEEASKDALVQTHRQLGILYQASGTMLNSATLWSKIGATPMIGQNDIAGEIFSPDDAKGLNEFAVSRKVGRMSMWSANRDKACGDNYVDVKVVSDSCSGVNAGKHKFAQALSKNFKGSLSLRAGAVTKSDPSSTVQKKDDPAASPYQIWSEPATYLEGTKVVWHRNVYAAKWWTQGDMPDDPVLDSWQSPWELIGPVLPDEKPVPQATLPAGTYPEWAGTDSYDTGARVLFNGAPYQAKWWNQGQSPAAASANPDSSPWTPLTQTQINAVEKEKRTSESTAG